MQLLKEASVKETNQTIINYQRFEDYVEYRKTCQSCASQKRKCGGEKPCCSRCIRLGKTCFYEPVKQRGRKRKDRGNIKLHKIMKLRHDNQLKSYGNHSLVSFLFNSVLRSTKAASVSVLNFDISRHLSAFRSHCVSKNLDPSYFPVSSIASALSKEDNSFFFSDVNSRKLDWKDWKEFSLFDPRVGSEFNKTVKMTPMLAGMVLLPLRRAKYNNSFPCVRIRSDISTTANPKERYLDVEMNLEFTRVFGVTVENIREALSNSLLGFLPFGTGIMSSISPEDELRRYLEIHCLKMQFLPKPQSVPWLWESFDISPFKLYINSGKKNETASFILTSAIRYLNTNDVVFEEVYIAPKPVEELMEIPDKQHQPNDGVVSNFDNEMENLMEIISPCDAAPLDIFLENPF
eukprot:snap_masked-scaffold_3-processed-gene-7.15-mRNA-1 protein AED:1.00 eAED:1.00 QI:0/-1/0/0/-1/1/1/0/404